MRLAVLLALAISILCFEVSLDRVFASSVSQAPDSGAISGRVVDERGDAIAGAQVNATGALGLTVTALTDSQGGYRLILPAGKYELRVEAKGFKTSVQGSTVTAGREAIVTWLLLVPTIPEIVTVTAARVERRLDQLPASVTVLEATDVATAAAQTVDDLLRQVPGFSIFRRSSSLVANPTTQGVSLRGAGATGASRTLVLNDGLPLNDAFGGWVYWDRIPRAAIQQIEVVRGGSSDLYGSDALSGVINVLSRSTSSHFFSGEVSYGNRKTADLSLFAGIERKNWLVTLGGEMTTTDGYFIVAPEVRGPADEAAASKHRVLTLRVARVWGDPSAGVVPNSIFLRGALFDEDRKNGTPLQRNDTTTESLAAGFRFQTPDRSIWQLALFGNQQRYHQSSTAVTADRAREALSRLQAVPSKDAGFLFSWSRSAGRHLLVAGADLRGVRGFSDEVIYVGGVATTFVSAGGRQRRFGIFGQDLIALSDRWQLVLSARWDKWRDSSAYSVEKVLATGVVRPRFFPERDEGAFSPRAALLFHINEQTSLRLAAYRAFRAPTLNELYRSFRVGDTLTLANERLEAERLTGGEGGIGWKLGEQLNSRVTGYWTETVNPIANFTLSVAPALITRERRNLGQTRSAGIEAESDLRIDDDWHLSAGYLFAHTNVLEAPQDVRLVGLWIPQVPRHQFTLQTVYSNPKYVTAAVQFRATGKQFDDDQNRLALDGFATVDLMVQRRLMRGLDLFFAVQNVLDERYVVGRTPIETIGQPRLFRGGLRIKLGK